MRKLDYSLALQRFTLYNKSTLLCVTRQLGCDLVRQGEREVKSGSFGG